MSFIKKFLHDKLGVDKAIAYTILTRGTQLISALFTIYFTTRFLSSDEQGYYYTFSSILALQVFFELGFTGIITQFVAHEASHLSWNDKFELIGDKKNKSRLTSLIHFCVKWYTRLAILLLIALIIAGILFFQKYKSDNNITWKLPWIFLVFGTCINFMIAPISSFLEGLAKVEEIAKVRFVQQIVSPIIFCCGLAMGAKLFVSGFVVFSTSIIFLFLVFKFSLYKYLKTIWKQEVVEKVSYIKEVFPYQWRIALSWISGYFIFQLFNPVLFASEGPTIAGQMGMTLNALNALLAMAYSWINTKVPTMSGLIALKDYKQLDNLFFKTRKQILFVAISIVFLFIVAIYILQNYNIPVLSHIGSRFLPLIPLSIFSFALLLQVPINCWAIYLRCHKKEPLLTNSVVGGILSCISVLTLGKYFGLYGLIMGFLFMQITTGALWVYLVFKKKRYEWHHESI